MKKLHTKKVLSLCMSILSTFLTVTVAIQNFNTKTSNIYATTNTFATYNDFYTMVIKRNLKTDARELPLGTHAINIGENDTPVTIEIDSDKFTCSIRDSYPLYCYSLLHSSTNNVVLNPEFFELYYIEEEESYRSLIIYDGFCYINNIRCTNFRCDNGNVYPVNLNKMEIIGITVDTPVYLFNININKN